MDAIRRITRSPGALWGASMLLVLVLVSLFAPYLAPHDPTQQDWGKRLAAPSADYPFGTDEFGRCLLSRIMYGGRISLITGLLPVLLGAFTGSILGILSGFFGKWMDGLIMRFMDILLSFPSIFLALAIVGAFGPGFVNAVIAVAVVSIPSYARIVRGEVLRIRQAEFIEAARAMGAGNPRIIARYILPNIIAPIIVQSSLSVGFAILSTAGLSFLGLGVQPPTPDWGEMLSSGRRFLPEAYWLELFPGLFIMAAVLSANLLGDGLRDALDPRTRM